MVYRSDNFIDIHVAAPTRFIVSNWQSLLPDWQIPPQTIAMVFLKSKFPLDAQGDLISLEKDRLLYRFLEAGKVFHSLSHQRGFLAEIISPKDGTPQYSKKGELTFDLVAIVHESIGFDFSRTEEGCKVLKHPEWGAGIYPGLFASEAPAASVRSILSEIVWG